MPDHLSSIRSTWHDHAARSRQPPCRLPGGRDRCPAGPRCRCRPGRGPSNPSAGRVRPAEDTRHEQHHQGDPGGRGGDCRGRGRDQPSASKRRRRGRTELGISVSRSIDRPECLRFAAATAPAIPEGQRRCGSRHLPVAAGGATPADITFTVPAGWASRYGIPNKDRGGPGEIAVGNWIIANVYDGSVSMAGVPAQPTRRPDRRRPGDRAGGPERPQRHRAQRTSCWAATPQSGSSCRSPRTSTRPPATKGSSGPGWHLVKTPSLVDRRREDLGGCILVS